MCPLLHYVISHILWLCFEFSLSSVQGQWPSEMSFLVVRTYVGEVHTETRCVWLCLCERRTKTEVTLQRGWRVCCSSAQALRNLVPKFPLPYFSQEIKLMQKKATCQWRGVIKDVIWKVCVCMCVCERVCCPSRVPSCMPSYLPPAYSGDDMLLSISSDSPFKHVCVCVCACFSMPLSCMCTRTVKIICHFHGEKLRDNTVIRPCNNVLNSALVPVHLTNHLKRN